MIIARAKHQRLNLVGAAAALLFLSACIGDEAFTRPADNGSSDTAPQAVMKQYALTDAGRGMLISIAQSPDAIARADYFAERQARLDSAHDGKERENIKNSLGYAWRHAAQKKAETIVSTDAFLKEIVVCSDDVNAHDQKCGSKVPKMTVSVEADGQSHIVDFQTYLKSLKLDKIDPTFAENAVNHVFDVYNKSLANRGTASSSSAISTGWKKSY